jgi:T5orf172 domain
MAETKKCPGCEQVLPKEAFGKDKNSSTGLQWRCKTCCNTWAAMNRARNMQKNILKSENSVVQVNATKLCKACGVTKQLCDFPVDRHMPDGVYYKCKQCKALDCKELRQRHKGACPQKEVAPALYVMQNPLLPHLVKVGQAIDVAKRAELLSSSHPFDLVICHQYLGHGHLEPIIHDRLRSHRFTGSKASKGREWFEVTPQQADGIIRGAIAEWELAHAQQSKDL